MSSAYDKNENHEVDDAKRVCSIKSSGLKRNLEENREGVARKVLGGTKIKQCLILELGRETALRSKVRDIVKCKREVQRRNCTCQNEITGHPK